MSIRELGHVRFRYLVRGHARVGAPALVIWSLLTSGSGGSKERLPNLRSTCSPTRVHLGWPKLCPTPEEAGLLGPVEDCKLTCGGEELRSLRSVEIRWDPLSCRGGHGS